MAGSTATASSIVNHTPTSGTKASNGIAANGMNSTNPSLAGGLSGMGGLGGLEDGDNRTRNAKAQRRHREKRKAHLKALEESVQVLTAQLEDARRQLGQAAYFSQNGQRPPGTPLSPSGKDSSQLAAENAYLRDENADLRRQLYSYRATYGHPPPPPPDGVKDAPWTEVKSEQTGFAYPQPGGPGGASPRRHRGSGGEVGQAHENSVPSTADGPSSASSSTSYPPPIDHFGPMHQRPRSRVMSSGSAPGASPYLQSDPRGMDSRYPGPPMRYEAQSGMYSAPPPHSVPRYDVPQSHSHPYAPRNDGHDAVAWPPEVSPTISFHDFR
ncbi:hypothetical protein DB88DRAFT_473590 [Papiliotrema laurentii]|uniref:BZIP domain-containing protein n=1 Tax=Papiliotrema laurentii TaxID=5418 RepID=A0AAD9CWK9_PAPLA|nr:hypothetical protein DB88DRAFT_473590 [Papiliotrema laurentii]